MEEKDRYNPGDFSGHLEKTIADGAVSPQEQEQGKLLVFQTAHPGSEQRRFERVLLTPAIQSAAAFFDLIASTYGCSYPHQHITIMLAPKALTKLKACYEVDRTCEEELHSILDAVRFGKAQMEAVVWGRECPE